MTRIDDLKAAIHDRLVAILQKFQDAAAAAGGVGDLGATADEIMDDLRSHAADLVEYLSNFVPGGTPPPVDETTDPQPPDPDAPPAPDQTLPGDLPPDVPPEVPVDTPPADLPPDVASAEVDLHERLTEILGELDATAAELDAMADRVIADLKAHAYDVVQWLQGLGPHPEQQSRGKKG